MRAHPHRHTPYREIAKTRFWQRCLSSTDTVPQPHRRGTDVQLCRVSSPCSPGKVSRVEYICLRQMWVFQCRTALPVTEAIRLGASCFGLAGKCEAIATSPSLAANNRLTWKLSCLLSACLFPVLQTNSWILGWQGGFHLQLEDHVNWKLSEGIIPFWVALAL